MRPEKTIQSNFDLHLQMVKQEEATDKLCLDSFKTLQKNSLLGRQRKIAKAAVESLLLEVFKAQLDKTIILVCK